MLVKSMFYSSALTVKKVDYLYDRKYWTSAIVLSVNSSIYEAAEAIQYRPKNQRNVPKKSTQHKTNLNANL